MESFKPMSDMLIPKATLYTRLDPALLKRVKSACGKLNVTQNGFVIQALEYALEHMEKDDAD